MGFCLTNQQLSEGAVDSFFQSQKKLEAKVYGMVSKVEEKTSVYAITLKDVVLSLEREAWDHKYHENKLLAYIPKEDRSVQIGDLICITGEIGQFKKATNEGQFDEWLYYKSKHITYKIYSKTCEIYEKQKNPISYHIKFFRDQLKNVYQKGLNETDQGIVTAMITGDQSLLEEETKVRYQRSGISHILAISGLHISLIGMCFFRLLHKMRCHLSCNTILTTVFLVCYGMMTDFSISTSRAIVMLLISLYAPLLGCTYDRKSAIAFSGLMLLITSPLLLFQAGFLLSFGAVLSITYIYPIFEDRITSYYYSIKRTKKHALVVQGMLKAFFLSFSIQIGTLPIILSFYFEFSLYGMVLNLVVVPLMTVLVLCAVMGGLLGIICLPIGVFFFGAVHVILKCYDVLCLLVENMPYNTQILGQPKPWMLIFYYCILLVFIVFEQQKKYSLMIMLLCLCVLFLPKNKKGLEITFLDVGQGDGIFVHLDGESMLIDCGSTDVKQVGKYRLIPFLKSKGIKTIDYMVVTHADQDHISGFKEMLAKEQKDIKVKNLVLAKTNDVDEAYEDIGQMAVEKGVTVRWMKKGDIILLGKKKERAKFTCLHPDAIYEAASRNDYSIVLQLVYRRFLALFTGDLEEAGETSLEALEQLATSYHVLKVAHHGSKFSTQSSFLEKVKPMFSIISCGEDNSYGHPHKELLERLIQSGSKTYITSKVGAVTLQSNGIEMRIE